MAAEFNVNILPFNQSGTFSCSQYDVGRTATITLLDEEGEYSIPTGATVTINATKPSGFGFSEECEWDGSAVTIETTATMTEEAGKFPAELRITSGDTVLVSANFLFRVEESAHPENVVDGDAETAQAMTIRVAALESDVADLKSAIGDLDDLTTETKTDLVSAINEARETIASHDKQLSVLYLYGSESEIQTNWTNRSKAKMNFRYVFHNLEKNKQKNGWCKLSLQGNATLAYPKHNFNIQFYKDAGYTSKDKVDYMHLTDDKHPKWTIKANYNDYSQARNVVSARLWGDVVHCRSNMSKALSEAPNHGAIDGHPVILMLNDAYYGLYMYNMSKSDWMLGIDEDNPMHCAVSANLATNDTKWLHVGLSGWELEIPDTWQTVDIEGVSTSVQAGFLALQSFVINSTDAEFYSNLGDYLDVNSAIDYLIYSFCVCNADSMNKNQFLVTWDAGKTWVFTAYDMDQTFGAGFGVEIPYNHNLFTTHPNHLFERLISNFAVEIMARYQILRGSVFSTNYVKRELEILFNEIPDTEREKDKALYPGMMFQSISTLSAMQTFAQNRLVWCDTYFARIDPSYIACTGLTLNQSVLSFNSLSSVQLTATKTPSNASDPVVWTSSNPSAATVSESGLVTAVANGTSTIMATCGDVSTTCTVTVALVERGTVDYTIDGITGATWSVGARYNPETGVLEEVANEHYTDKFHLQDCLYTFTGGAFKRLYCWDENGEYKGCTGEADAVISARSDYYYAVRVYNSQNASLMPINNSATMGSSKSITISSVNGYISNVGFGYNNQINAEFAGLITSTSGTLDYSAVDWIWCDNFVVLYNGDKAPQPNSSDIIVKIQGSGASVEVWLYSTMFANKDEFNAYLAEHPIMLLMNYS